MCFFSQGSGATAKLMEVGGPVAFFLHVKVPPHWADLCSSQVEALSPLSQFTLFLGNLHSDTHVFKVRLSVPNALSFEGGNAILKKEILGSDTDR